MDKNTWIGFLLIAAIIVGFSFINRPSKEELAERQRIQDSIATIRAMDHLEAQLSHTDFTLANVGKFRKTQDSAMVSGMTYCQCTIDLTTLEEHLPIIQCTALQVRFCHTRFWWEVMTEAMMTM